MGRLINSAKELILVTLFDGLAKSQINRVSAVEEHNPYRRDTLRLASPRGGLAR